MFLTTVFLLDSLRTAINDLFSRETRKSHRASVDYDDRRALNQRCREDLATVYRGLDYYGYNQSVCNHLTMRAPARDGDGEVMLVIAHGLHWSEVTPSSLIGVDIASGHVVEGEGTIQIEALGIHTVILSARPDVECCLHVHSTYCTALGMLENEEFRFCHQNDCMFYNDIAYFSDFGGSGAKEGEGDKMARSLGDKTVLFMRNHGVAVVSASLSEAFYKLYHLEWCCKYQMVAMATGKKLLEIPDQICKETSGEFQVDKYHRNLNSHYGRLLIEALKRIFSKKDPGYLCR